MPQSKNDKLRILLVDDEQDITAIMKSGLQNHGYDVDTFNNPSDAISHFKPDFYDVIILDVRMPEISGFELARMIWKEDANARICFMTAFEIYEKEAKAVFPNFKTHCFIAKPILPNALIKHIQSHFA